MKENKPIVVSTNPKYKFHLSISKPAFLIPFNTSRLLNPQSRKAQTPNRQHSPNHKSINGPSLPSSKLKKDKKILVSKSSSQRFNNPPHLEEQKSLRVYHTTTLENGTKSLFTKKLSSNVFRIVHRKAPSVKDPSRYTLDRYNTNIQNTNHSTLSHSSKLANDIFRENSRIFVNMKSNQLNNSHNEHCSTRNGAKKIMANLPRCSSERASKVNPNILSEISKKKGFAKQNSLQQKKKKDDCNNSREIILKQKSFMNAKSASEKKLNVKSIQEGKPKTKVASKSKGVFTRIDRNKNGAGFKEKSQIVQVKIDKKLFKEMNGSPLMKTKAKAMSKKIHKAIAAESRSKSSSICGLKAMAEDLRRSVEKNNSAVIIKKSSNGTDNENFHNHTLEENKKKIKKKVINFESITMKGYQNKAPKKANQDNYFIHNNINFEQSSMFVGVCDGHGENGHEVSEYLVAHLPTMLNASLIAKHQPLSNQSNLNAILADTFIRVNTRIINDVNINTLFSGSTCVSIIFTPEKITCGNVGDSRAIVGKLSNGVWSSETLSRDHKPSEMDEHDRIIKAGGRIEAYKDKEGKFLGPERVWDLEKDLPGLAMSRSFGDEVAQEIGVIAKPEVMEYALSQSDKFIVLASDGVWEFIGNEECVKIVKDFYLRNDISGALSALYEEASKRWLRKEDMIDDITAVILFLD